MSWTGKFDILFPGARLNCDTAAKAEKLRKYLNSNYKNSFTLDVTQCSSQNEYIDAMLYNTSYFHESRHVHDYLLSPILNYGYRLRLLAVLHACQVPLKWPNCNPRAYNILPVPIHEWFKLSASEQKQFVERWSKGNMRACPPMFSINGMDSFRDYLEDEVAMSMLDSMSALLLYASGYYEEYTKISAQRFDAYGREYSVKTIMEASAVTAQMAAIEKTYGQLGKSLFWQTLVDASKKENRWKDVVDKNNSIKRSIFSSYTVILSYLTAYLKYNQSIGLENLFIFTSYFMNWCLSGNLLSKDAITFPAVRLHTFAENDFARGITINMIEDDPLAVFSYWDQKLGCESINYEEYFKNNSDLYQEISEKFRSIGLTQVADYVNMIGDASKVMTATFCLNPQRYLNPIMYLDSITEYVNVPIQFDLKHPMDVLEQSTMNTSIIDDNLKSIVESTQQNVIKGVSIDNPYIPIFGEKSGLSSKYSILSYQKCEQFRLFFETMEMMFKDGGENAPEDFYNTVMTGCQIRYVF